jgi:predicted RNA-binding protein YlqC (UPF0109 family)
VEELVALVVKALVDNPERVSVTEVEGERSIVVEVRVAEEDMGKVIGKGGRIANALRIVAKAAGAKRRKNIWVDIDRLPEGPAAPAAEET